MIMCVVLIRGVVLMILKWVLTALFFAFMFGLFGKFFHWIMERLGDEDG